MPMAVIGFVIEAMRKRASLVIGWRASTSCRPTACEAHGLIVAADHGDEPAICPWSTNCCIRLEIVAGPRLPRSAADAKEADKHMARAETIEHWRATLVPNGRIFCGYNTGTSGSMILENVLFIVVRKAHRSQSRCCPLNRRSRIAVRSARCSHFLRPHVFSIMAIPYGVVCFQLFAVEWLVVAPHEVASRP